MGPIIIESTNRSNANDPKPNLWFGRREWHWAVRMALAVTLLTLIGWSFYGNEEPVPVYLDAYAAGEPYPGQPGYDGPCIDDYGCGQAFPQLSWYQEITIIASTPVGVKFGDTFAAFSFLMVEDLTWVQDQKDMTFQTSIWVPKAYLHHNTYPHRNHDLFVCDDQVMSACVLMLPEKTEYVLVSD